ncbi:hypothetical protein PTI45_03801 [Paenibacillus nuruki]|uniref:Uncharacterized protein n=1 Tax=Paenibacillus nuruki TaxID=1886670 RepID=A0A1E3L1K9_9BACL|nr:hypothetical protein PTI45_03801 [Paenibacillus nuruki]TKJ87229.1 hypothetical protein PaeCFBP13512_18580 [Paenibacillus sp. CFBP13512]
MIYIYCALGIAILLSVIFTKLKNNNLKSIFSRSKNIMPSQNHPKIDIPSTSQRWKLPQTDCFCKDKEEDWIYDEDLGCWYVCRECNRCEYYWEGSLYIHEDRNIQPR